MDAHTSKNLLLCWREPHVNATHIHDMRGPSWIFSYFLPWSQWIVLSRNHRISPESNSAFWFIGPPLIKYETYLGDLIFSPLLSGLNWFSWEHWHRKTPMTNYFHRENRMFLWVSGEEFSQQNPSRERRCPFPIGWLMEKEGFETNPRYST